MERSDYAWVNESSGVAVASCFSFFDGPTVDEVVAAAGIRETRVGTFAGAESASSRLVEDEVAMFSASGWTVGYEPNGYPDRFAGVVASGERVRRSVIVYWNVNAVTEFAYWEHGERVVAFDWPQERWGSDPDRLLVAMRETVGLERTGEEGRSVFEVYQQMLELAERITGVHLGPDFLHRPEVVVVGRLDDDVEDPKRGQIDPYGRPVADETDGEQANADRSVQGDWTPEERRRNKQALEAIPRDRWPEVPARLARLACERVRIAERFPVADILEALDNNERPSPARLTSRHDVWACVEDVTFSKSDRPTPERVMAAIEAVFTASRPSSRRAPLRVLQQARIAANDRGTDLIDLLRTEMGA